MRRRHRMRFGTDIEDQGVRFSLWAPEAERVDLCIEGQGSRYLPMERGSDGFFWVLVPEASAGTLYRFRINGTTQVPDPASRFQPKDVAGPSEVIDPESWEWQDVGWKGRPWHEAVIYELHVGAFTAGGTFEAALDQLDYLARLGITAIELMPVWDFPGRRNFGYDGVLPFAPDSSFGRPEHLKGFVQAAHSRGLMVFLDVVYNHFGPEGNYLHLYAPQFFTKRHHTPWGDAINFDDQGSEWVRRFFIHNALYWLEEYHFDGLRLDAVHAIVDDSPVHFLEELSQAVRIGPGKDRHVHLVLENERNEARFLERDPAGESRFYTAQWNDDIHHVLHVSITGEGEGYYSDYADCPSRHLARCLSEGFAYQGEESSYRQGELRGEPSSHLPPTAFVSFLQNHDQVGNRAFGDRIARLASPEALHAAVAVYLLAPSPPLLFMGEEWGATQPFRFFCDFEDNLAQAVREGRKREFARFASFSDPVVRETIPDPCAEETFKSSVLDRAEAHREPHRSWLAYYMRLLALRHAEIIPRLQGLRGGSSGSRCHSSHAVTAWWRLGDGSRLALATNLGPEEADIKEKPPGERLFAFPGDAEVDVTRGLLPGFSTCWFIDNLNP